MVNKFLKFLKNNMFKKLIIYFFVNLQNLYIYFWKKSNAKLNYAIFTYTKSTRLHKFWKS